MMKELLKKFEKEAYELGLNYFVAVGDGKNDIIVKSNNVGENSNISDLQKYWGSMNKKFSTTTFKDLYEYIQQAEKDKYGYHYPFKSKEYSFHIYNGGKQVNICRMNEYNHNSMVNIIFNPDSKYVLVVKVNQQNLVADYDNPLKLNWETSVSDKLWVEFAGTPTFITEIIRDALGPFKASQ